MSRFLFADLVVESDVPLLDTSAAVDGEPGCVIRVMSPGEPEPPPAGWQHQWRLPDGRVSLSYAEQDGFHRLGFPGLAECWISADGREVGCRPASRTGAPTLRHLLLDQVLPRVLSLRGRLVLHAGAVETPRGACLFLGDSGLGKSTLCASFSRRGFPLLTDDCLVVRESPDRSFAVVPAYPGLRLLPDVFARFFGEGSEGTEMAHYSPKVRASGRALSLSFTRRPSRLARLYLLASPERVPRDGGVEIEPVSPREAFMGLVRNSFQLAVADRTLAEGIFRRCGELVDRVPSRRLVFLRDLALLAEVRAAVLADSDCDPAMAARFVATAG